MHLLKKLFVREDGFTSLQMALGFGLFGLAAAALLVPASNQSNRQVAQGDFSGVAGIDRTVTGSVRGQQQNSRTQRYTIRRSVLQSDREARCIIFQNGRREGDC